MPKQVLKQFPAVDEFGQEYIILQWQEISVDGLGEAEYGLKSYSLVSGAYVQWRGKGRYEVFRLPQQPLELTSDDPDAP